MKKIAATVVLYNPDNNVSKNIESYLSLVDKLYVVDNSANNNFNLLNKSKKIKYIPNFKNLGIAKGFNIGVQEAIKDKYEWVLTMDQDSRFDSEELKKMIKYLDNIEEDVGLICPWHMIKTTSKRPSERVEQMLEVMSSGSILKVSAYNKIGGFKDWLFIDNVDIDYCFNLNVNSYRVLRLNYVSMHHNLGDASIHRFLWKKVVVSNHNYIRRYYITRNILYTISMYKNDFPDYCKYLKKCLNYNFKTVLLFEKDKIRKFRSMIRGYLDYKNNIKGEYPYEN